jgi:hypothetical protein
MATPETEARFNRPEFIGAPGELHHEEPIDLGAGLTVAPEDIGRSMLTSVQVFAPSKKGRPTTLRVQKEGMFSMATVRHPELLPLADYVALEMMQNPFLEWSDDEIIGLTQETGHDIEGVKRIKFLNILSLHANVAAIDEDVFETSGEAEFMPFTEDFDPDSVHKAKDGEALSDRQLGRILKAMREDPEYKRFRLEKSRIANPKRRGERKPKERIIPGSKGRKIVKYIYRRK